MITYTQGATVCAHKYVAAFHKNAISQGGKLLIQLAAQGLNRALFLYPQGPQFIITIIGRLTAQAKNLFSLILRET